MVNSGLVAITSYLVGIIIGTLIMTVYYDFKKENK